MKAIILIILSCAMFCMAGCEKSGDFVSVQTGNMFIFDDVNIPIKESYNFFDYTKDYKDNDCIITLRFKNESEVSK